MSIHQIHVNKSQNQNVVSRNAVQSKASAVFSAMSTYTVLKSSTRMAVEEGESECKTSDANGASPPPWLSGYARMKQPAAPGQKGVQHSLVVQVERAAKESGSDPGTDTAAAGLSQAPVCAACVPRAGRQKTSKRP